MASSLLLGLGCFLLTTTKGLVWDHNIVVLMHVLGSLVLVSTDILILIVGIAVDE